MASPRKHIVIVGAGGNIGSAVVSHVARMSSVSRITLVDHDCYEPKNLAYQNINVADIGRPKVYVQADKIAAIRPGVSVEKYVQRVETLPRGVFAGDVILACLDNLSARQITNQAAFRLGVPWIDSGIRADGLLARVNVYASRFDAPCLECGWGQRDYDLLDQLYPCQAELRPPVPTNASTSLGALAASWQTLECEKLLVGGPGDSLVNRQVLIDAHAGKLYVTHVRKNPECRFDHKSLRPTTHSLRLRETTVDRLLSTLPLRNLAIGTATLVLEGFEFTRRLFCASCRKEAIVLAVPARLSPVAAQCTKCGRPMQSVGAFQCEALDAHSMSDAERSLSLYAIGFRDRDVITVASTGSHAFHYEIRDDAT